VPLAVGLVMVFAFSLTWVWMTLGLVMRSAVAVTMLSFLVQFPLVFASNTFVDPGTMPGWLRAFVDVNPVSHLVTAERGLLNGNAALTDVAWPLAASAVLVALFAPLTFWLYNRKQ
jgi:ABC-2 type transport system permease protein